MYPISIEVLLKETAMEIKIWDYGSAFDLHCYNGETSQKHHNGLARSGGISIFNKCDRLDYCRTE